MNLDGITRRTVVGGAAICAVAAQAKGQPAKTLRYGVQLYPLMSLFAADMPGLFDRLASAGFDAVEFAGFAQYGDAAIRQALRNSGLFGIGAHCLPLTLDEQQASKELDRCAAIGLRTAVTALASVRPTPASPLPRQSAIFRGPSVDDLRWSAERMNRFGELARARGLLYSYHVHNIDLRPLEGATGLDWLMKLTNPGTVSLQLDVGNAVVAGADPLQLIRQYHRRIRSVHVKDWTPGFMPSFGLQFPIPNPFGSGVINWKSVLDALGRRGMTDVVVEQEAAPGVDILGAQIQALKYLKNER